MTHEDQMKNALQLVEPAFNSIMGEYVSRKKATDWALVNEMLMAVKHALWFECSFKCGFEAPTIYEMREHEAAEHGSHTLPEMKETP